MQHHGRMPRTVFADIGCTQAVWQHEINLECAALPITANRVTKHELKLGTVECALARVQFNLKPSLANGVQQRFLGFIPYGIFACAHIGITFTSVKPKSS